MLEDGLEDYNMDINVVGLAETVAGYLDDGQGISATGDKS
jgi:hypothetical protein